MARVSLLRAGGLLLLVPLVAAGGCTLYDAGQHERAKKVAERFKAIELGGGFEAEARDARAHLEKVVQADTDYTQARLRTRLLQALTRDDAGSWGDLRWAPGGSPEESLTVYDRLQALVGWHLVVAPAAPASPAAWKAARTAARNANRPIAAALEAWVAARGQAMDGMLQEAALRAAAGKRLAPVTPWAAATGSDPSFLQTLRAAEGGLLALAPAGSAIQRRFQALQATVKAVAELRAKLAAADEGLAAAKAELRAAVKRRDEPQVQAALDKTQQFMGQLENLAAQDPDRVLKRAGLAGLIHEADLVRTRVAVAELSMLAELAAEGDSEANALVDTHVAAWLRVCEPMAGAARELEQIWHDRSVALLLGQRAVRQAQARVQEARVAGARRVLNAKLQQLDALVVEAHFLARAANKLAWIEERLPPGWGGSVADYLNGRPGRSVFADAPFVVDTVSQPTIVADAKRKLGEYIGMRLAAQRHGAGRGQRAAWELEFAPGLLALELARIQYEAWHGAMSLSLEQLEAVHASGLKPEAFAGLLNAVLGVANAASLGAIAGKVN